MVIVLLLIAGLVAWYLIKQGQRDKLFKEVVETVYHSALMGRWLENADNLELEKHQTLNEWDLENGLQMAFDVCALLGLDDADPSQMKFAEDVVDAVNERAIHAVLRYNSQEQLGQETEEHLAAVPLALQRELRRDREE